LVRKWRETAARKKEWITDRKKKKLQKREEKKRITRQIAAELQSEIFWPSTGKKKEEGPKFYRGRKILRHKKGGKVRKRRRKI